MNYDTVFISDVHLGTNRSSTKKFINFLQNLRTKKLVLIGDIIDIYCMEKYKTNWTRGHTKCIHGLLEILKSGTEIIYVLGNHEYPLRKYADLHLNNFSMVNEYVHIDSKNNSYLCVHGDRQSKYSSGSWKQLFLNWGYEFISPINKIFNNKLIDFIKSSPRAQHYISSYENDMINYGQTKNHNGVIVGHIHHANIREQDNILYMCPGDFVDFNCAIVEKDGIYCLQSY